MCIRDQYVMWIVDDVQEMGVVVVVEWYGKLRILFDIQCGVGCGQFFKFGGIIGVNDWNVVVVCKFVKCLVYLDCVGFVVGVDI